MNLLYEESCNVYYWPENEETIDVDLPEEARLMKRIMVYRRGNIGSMVSNTKMWVWVFNECDLYKLLNHWNNGDLWRDGWKYWTR